MICVSSLEAKLISLRAEMEKERQERSSLEQMNKNLKDELNVADTGRATLVAKLEESQVPFARVKNLKEVLTEPQSQRMILDNPIVGRKEGKYISNIAFQAEF